MPSHPANIAAARPFVEDYLRSGENGKRDKILANFITDQYGLNAFSETLTVIAAEALATPNEFTDWAKSWLNPQPYEV